MNQKEKRDRGTARVLSVLLAVLLCATLTVGAGAQALEETVETTVPVQETVVEEASEAVMPEETAPEESATTESVSAETAISAAQLLAAKEELLALLPEAVKEQNADVIQSAGWNDAFCREDVLSAVQMNTQVIRSRQELERKQEELSRAIQENKFLTDEQRTYFLTSMEAGNAELLDDLTEKLFSALRNLTEKNVSTEEMVWTLTSVTVQSASLDGLSQLLAELEAWAKSEEQIAFISGYLAEQDNRPAGQSSVTAQCKELVQRAEELRSDVNAYFTLSSEEQTELVGLLRALCEDVDAFYMDAILDNARALDELRNQTEQLSRKLTPGYIALGVSVLGVLIGVIAVVLALSKRSDEPALDVTTLASRETAEKLDEQNRNLAGRISTQDEMLHKQISRQNEQIEALKAQIQELRQHAASAPQQQKDSGAVQQQTLATAQVRKASKVCDLKLEFNSYSPGSSFLNKSDHEGEYALYDDDTVEFVNAHPESWNQLSGWSSKGLFYLFDPEIDGQKIDSEKCQEYMDFYRAASTVRRAKVQSINGGAYIIAEKGTVAMKGM